MGLKQNLIRSSAIALAFSAANAQAGAIVTQWSFSTDSDFTNASFQSGGSGVTTATDHELSWGNASGNFQNPTSNSANNRSALTIGSASAQTLTGGGPATGTINTSFDNTPDILAGELGLGTNFTHWNNTISGSFNTLLSGSVFDTLTLTPLAPAAGPSVNAPDLTFNFEFRETSNAGPCAGGTTTPCGDLFGFAGTPNLNLLFEYDDVDYYASIFVLNTDLTGSPIAFLNDGQCAALGFTTGPSGQRCQGFLTAESQATTVQFGFAITTEPFSVPAPGTLALMGLSMLGFVGTRKRRQK